MLVFDKVELRQGSFVLRADLQVRPGLVTAIMGPSGGGKSTLLAGLAGFLRPVAGRILWQGQVLNDLPPADRPVDVLFQDQNLFPHLTVSQNLWLAFGPRLSPTAAERARAEAVLETVGLTGLGERKPGSLSGGQQSRVALARVALGNRPILALDEPFAALGPAQRDAMLDLVTGLGRTVLMVTHDPGDARRSAAETLVVEGGEVVAPRPTAEVLDDPTPGLAAYLGSRRA